MKHRPRDPIPTSLAFMANGMAHEFNNLLGAIQGYASLIVEDTDEESPARHHAAHILEASRCGLRLIEQIILASGAAGGCRSRFDVADLVDEVAGKFAAGSQIHLHRPERHSASLMIEGDRMLLGRVLLNLCANAAEALKGCSGTIEISARPARSDASINGVLSRVTEAGTPGRLEVFQDGETCWAAGGDLLHDLDGCVSLIVTDSGSGMHHEVLCRAFDPFFTTRERAIHTGLGLAIVHGVTVAHGGAIVMDTTPGKGTRARVILPPSLG